MEAGGNGDQGSTATRAIRASTPVRSIERDGSGSQRVRRGRHDRAGGGDPAVGWQRDPVTHDDRGRIAVDGTMRSGSDTCVGTGRLRDDSGPDSRPYPALAQHAIRERGSFTNVAAVVAGSPCSVLLPRPGHHGRARPHQCRAQVLGFRIRGFRPGGFDGPTTCSRCRGGTGGSGSCSTDRGAFFRPDITRSISRSSRIRRAKPRGGNAASLVPTGSFPDADATASRTGSRATPRPEAQGAG